MDCPEEKTVFLLLVGSFYSEKKWDWEKGFSAAIFREWFNIGHFCYCVASEDA
jgi:hypothetical protein